MQSGLNGKEKARLVGKALHVHTQEWKKHGRASALRLKTELLLKELVPLNT